MNEIITEAKGVFNTVNKKFNMNQTDFEKKFSESVKNNIISTINDKFELISKESEIEINKMKNKISSELSNLSCFQSDPKEFKKQFDITKIKVNTLIGSTSYDIENIYDNFKTLMTKIIDEHIIDDIESEKKEIDLIHITKLDKNFNDIDFEIMGRFKHFFKNIFGVHDYKDDIKQTCKNYKEMIESAYKSIEDELNEKIKDLKNKGIRIIKIIFDTANSNFVELERNFKRYDEINKLFQNLLKNNNL